jgi:hypothetical protein
MSTEVIYMVEADSAAKDGIIFACVTLPVVIA